LDLLVVGRPALAAGVMAGVAEPASRVLLGPVAQPLAKGCIGIGRRRPRRFSSLRCAVLRTVDSWPSFTETGKNLAPAWRNEVTLRSVEMLTEYEPAGYLPSISPTPLLMLVASGDHLVPSELATAAFEHAREPKQLIVLPGGHFDAYGAGFAAASAPARDWLVRHLAP